MSAYQRGNTIVRVNTQAIENNLTTQGGETKPLDGDKRQIFGDKTNILKDENRDGDEKNDEEQNLVAKQKFQFFIVSFIFFFFHFFSLILVSNIYRDMDNYIDQSINGKAFDDKFPELKPNAASLVTFNVLVLVMYVLSIVATIRLSQQSLNVCQILFILFYITKLGFEISFLGQNAVNDHIDENLEKISNNDEYRLYCSGEDQVKCRFFLSWKFFYVNLFVDLIICTIASAGFAFISRRFKVFLQQQDLAVKTLTAGEKGEISMYDSPEKNNQNNEYQGVLNDSVMNNSILEKSDQQGNRLVNQQQRQSSMNKSKKDEFSVISDNNDNEIEDILKGDDKQNISVVN